MNSINIPNHVAIIMDGNRRWAKERNLPSFDGHRAGLNNLIKLSKYIFETGTKYLSVFAFSTENFKRSEEEVKYLMDLFVKEFPKYIKEFEKNKIKVIFSGRRENLRADVLELVDSYNNKIVDSYNGVLNMCLNYGGEQEVVDACKKIVLECMNSNLDIDTINEESITKYLYHELPPIDLMIRTSGEYRISNFMLYYLAYAEMYFTETYFPSFDIKCYDEALADFSSRNRRFGGNNNES